MDYLDGLIIGAVFGFLIGLYLRPGSRPNHNLNFTMPDIKPKGAAEILADLKAQEQLEKYYKFVSYWMWEGEKIDKPADWQKRDPRLLRVDKWVKKNGE